MMTISTFLRVLALAGALFAPARELPAETAPSVPPAPLSPPAAGPDFTRLVEENASQLETIASNTEALTLFISKLGVPLGLEDAVGILKAGPRATAALPGSSLRDLESSAVRLTAALSAWHLAHTVRRGLTGAEDNVGKEVIEARQKQLVQMTALEPARVIHQMLPLLDAEEWARSVPGSDVEHPGYEIYRAAVDQAYPDTTGTDHAWMSVVERNGSAVLIQRLIEEPVGAPVPETIRSQMAARYTRQRLRPLIDARLQGLTAALEREAVVLAYAEWTALRTAKDRIRETIGLKRLCGSWQWIIHNHRNHGEHKTTMVFGSPESDRAGAPKPKEAVVLGDTVYLRWELPGGMVQEDSLLLVAGGKRLEGSFVNSAGAWGNITGKRLKACKTP